MSDAGDRNDGDASGDEESLAPRSRKRRGLRVPVDDVPRQSFVDLQRPPGARESGAGREPPPRVSGAPRVAQEMRVVPPEANETAPTRSTPTSTPTTSGPEAKANLSSVELSLDADLEVEAAPPPPPRSYRPPPPPPSWGPPPPAASPPPPAREPKRRV